MIRDDAEYLPSIDFDAGDIERMNLLSERAREGCVSADETAELDSYLHAGSLLSILQSKARRLLNSEIRPARISEPGIDPGSGELVRLFHPRWDLWLDHLVFYGAQLMGLTPIGRATVHVLAMNAHDVLPLRIEILKEGIVSARGVAFSHNAGCPR